MKEVIEFDTQGQGILYIKKFDPDQNLNSRPMLHLLRTIFFQRISKNFEVLATNENNVWFVINGAIWRDFERTQIFEWLRRHDRLQEYRANIIKVENYLQSQGLTVECYGERIPRD